MQVFFFIMCVFVEVCVSVIVNLNSFQVKLYKLSCVCVYGRGEWVGGSIFMFSVRVCFCARMSVDAVNVCLSFCKCFFVFAFVLYFYR